MELGVLLTIMVLGLWLAMKISAFLFKQAVAQVIGIFRTQEANTSENAKTFQELGLNPFGFTILRDYKPAALNLLVSTGVIVQTDDERFFLSERGLKVFCQSDRENRLGFCEPVRDHELVYEKRRY
jgi:hypothetical protein